jgi:hypothetical protein
MKEELLLPVRKKEKDNNKNREKNLSQTESNGSWKKEKLPEGLKSI